MPKLRSGRTGKLTGMPLADRLAVTLVLKGTLTMEQAMHLTGIVAPGSKDGDCGHQQGKAGDGRCLGCKREADQRTYRKRQYVAALAELVSRGVAVEGTTEKGTKVWQYTGPSYGYVPPKLPELPYEIDPDAAEHFQAAFGRPPTRNDGNVRGIVTTLQMMLESARNGNLPSSSSPHRSCSACLVAYAEGENAHADDSLAAITARTGMREDGHHNCWFCLRIDERADEQRRRDREQAERERVAEATAQLAETQRLERVRRYAEAHQLGTYAYDDGRRILRNGSLCDCPQCDRRQRLRQARETPRPSNPSGMASGVYYPGSAGNTTTAGTDWYEFRAPRTMQRWSWEVTDDAGMRSERTTTDGDENR